MHVSRKPFADHQEAGDTNNISTFVASSSILSRLSPRQRLTIVSLFLLALGLMVARAAAQTGPKASLLDVSVSNLQAESGVSANAEVPLELEITSPDQAGSTDVVSNDGSVNVHYESSVTTSSDPAQNNASASLTVNGQEVPVSSNGNVRTRVRSSGGSSSVNINVNSQKSTSGDQAGGQ